MDENILSVVLNGEETEIPHGLIENGDVFRDVLSYETWQTLTPGEKAHLQTFLPPSAETPRFQDETVRLLFSKDNNFKHGNPVSMLYRKLKGGRCSKSIIRRLQKCRSLKYKDYKLKEKQRCRRLLQRILVSRQRLLDQLARHSPGQPIQQMRSDPVDTSTSVDEKVHKKFQRIIKDVKAECQDESISSDEDEFSFQPYDGRSMLFSSNETQFPNRFLAGSALPSLPSHQYDPYRLPFTANEISDELYKSILERHRERRLCNEAHPELDVSAISLADIIMRAKPSKKANKKAKKFKKMKKGREEKIKSKKKYRSQLPPLTEKDIMRIKQFSSKHGNNGREEASQEDKIDEPQGASAFHSSSSENDEEEGEQCFFTLLKGYFMEKDDLQCSTAELQQEVVVWENSDESSAVSWTKESSSWSELVIPALNFLAGDMNDNALPSFSPVVAFMQDANQWKWIALDHDDENILVSLCKYWLGIVKQEKAGQANEHGTSSPTSLHQQRTDFVVRPSTDQEKMAFQNQERKRYENPHKPFIYKMHGFSSIVGPVKGVFNKDTGTSKAREHALLISNRPAYVTILSLVRDAVARLPNGEGTRAEVCQLLKDSQFINPEATDSQIHAVVSGALDRLHAEKDPCVKYDITRKLWVYLHRVRSVEEFERIHQASAAAAMAKKQMSQKQKVPGKKRSGQDQTSSSDDLTKIKAKPSKAGSDKSKKSVKRPKLGAHLSPNSEQLLPAEQSDIAGTPSSSPMNTSFHSDYLHLKDEVLTTTNPFAEHLAYFTQVRGPIPVSTSNQHSLQNAVPLKITFPGGALGSFTSTGMTLHIPKTSEHRVTVGASQQEPLRHVNLSEHLLLNQNSAEFLPQIDSTFEESLP